MYKESRANSVMKMNPMGLVKEAAYRVKLKSELKSDQISKIELQKEIVKHLQLKTTHDMLVLDAPRTRA